MANSKLDNRKLWPIILAVVLIAGAIGGFLAYRKYVIEPRQAREAVDDLIRCLKKSDAYESADDFRLRLTDPDYDYNNAVIWTDYGNHELADYFDDLFREQNYAEYIHDASVLVKNDYLNSADASLIIKDSTMAKLWEMGSPITPDDVERNTFGDLEDRVYFRNVLIENYAEVEDWDLWLFGEKRDDAEHCYGIINGHVYGSILIWPVQTGGEYCSCIAIDAENGSYFFGDMGYETLVEKSFMD